MVTNGTPLRANYDRSRMGEFRNPQELLHYLNARKVRLFAVSDRSLQQPFYSCC